MTGSHQDEETGERLRGLGIPVAFVLANGLLLAPGWILLGAPGPPWLAGEALLAVTVFLLLPARRWTGFVAAITSVVIVAAAVLLLGDAAARSSLSRPMNLYLDWHLLDAVWKLMVGAVGMIPAAVGLMLLLSVGILATWGIARSLMVARPVDGLWKGRVAGASGLLLALVVLTGWSGSNVLSWPGVTLAVDQVGRVDALLEERDRFARELGETRSSHAGVPDLLGALDDRSVVLAFIESYGMSVLEDPRYAGVLRPRLEELGRRMEKAGLSMATGSLVAPTQGGQSWFSHGSLLSGLWLDNQAKYDILLTTDRETLVDDFSRAGYETVALMPAITLAWPEGEWFGYDRIYAFDDIDYAGPPLNWVTMPDQFTWSFLETRILTDGRSAAGTTAGPRGVSGSGEVSGSGVASAAGATPRSDRPSRPVFAEVGLVSSHAPWTPILPVLSDWGSIGDGSIFAPWENAGERPEDLWRDVERVREQFALSVDYAVHAMTAYAERFVDDERLLIVMGDHQPAPLITGDGASRAVPVHVISGDPSLVEPFLRWGFREGALPDTASPAHRMDAFRRWFVDAFSGSAPST